MVEYCACLAVIYMWRNKRPQAAVSHQSAIKIQFKFKPVVELMTGARHLDNDGMREILSLGYAINLDPAADASIRPALVSSPDGGAMESPSALLSHRENKEDFEGFLGEEFDEYMIKMDQVGTWGDELTLVSIKRFFPYISWLILNLEALGI